MQATVEPPCSDAAVKDKTGRNWAEWCAALDSAGGTKLEHRELARLVNGLHAAGGWWSQMVAVGYERLRGKRAVRQQSSGHFAASVSKTLSVSAAAAHACFVDPALRSRWLDEPLEIRKATAPRSVRITWPDRTSVEVWITDKGDSKCGVAVQHTKLADATDVAARKHFWKAALQRLAAGVA